MRFNRTIQFAVGALATQLMLGCQTADREEAPLNGVVVPTSTDHPADLVGKWQEAKGSQTIDLLADGSCKMVNKVTIGPPGTPSSEKELSCKWGTKETKFYFSDITGSLPLAYDWESSGKTLILTNNGAKLHYVKITESKK